IAVAAVVAIALATYAADKFIPRPTPNADASIAQPPAAESAAGQAALPAGGSPDSGSESPHDDGARADVAAGTLVANPTDSARASAFAVAVAEVASETSANVTIDDESRKGLPALTVSPEEGKPPSGPLLGERRVQHALLGRLDAAGAQASRRVAAGAGPHYRAAAVHSRADGRGRKPSGVFHARL